MTNAVVRRSATRNLLFITAIGAAFVGADGLNTAAAQGQGRGRASALNGTYQLNSGASDNVSKLADQATASLAPRDRERLRRAILRRLEAPDALAIERRGRTITLASSNADRVTFEADGRTQTEQGRNGRAVRTTTRLSGDRLDVTTEGDRAIGYQVSFEPIDGGRRLRVTRRIDDERLRQVVVARSVYDRTSPDARLDMYTSSSRDVGRRDTGRRDEGYSNGRVAGVPDGTEIVATLDRDLSTKQSRPEDPFTLTVRSPRQFEGARIDGRVVNADRSGRVAGRAGMTFEFSSIRLANGRTSDFGGYLEGIRTTRGEALRVEGGVAEDDDSQTGRTTTRTGIGAGIGAIIGAITGGGKGAAIGAAVGAGAGAGSVIVEGRDDLELLAGSEFQIRAASPR
jgi:hypothetical protein